MILPINSLFIFLFLGQCFVPISDIQHLLTFQFKSLLTQNIALTAKILPNLDEDDRLIRMLSELDKRYTGADYTLDKNSKDTIKPEQIKPLKDNGAFPLCMRYMQTTLEKTHHLKYNSRLQYGLFLKGNTVSILNKVWTSQKNHTMQGPICEIFAKFF